LNLKEIPQQLLKYEDALPLPVRFRRAERRDASLLYAACFERRSSDQFHASFERALQAQRAGQRLVLVGETDSTPIASGQLIRHANRAEIADLAVAPAYQNQGVGTALITILARVAAFAGFEQVEIGVMAGNSDALKLYQRLGFYLLRRIPLPGDAEALVLGMQLNDPNQQAKR
jgi:ribosomal protein S18 acetylase RimI-like enzyme